MSRVAVNIIANFVGRGGSVLLALALVPLYVKWMGIEAYGLLSICTTIQALVSLFDLGFSSVLAREAAKIAPTENHRHTGLADLFRTFEVVMWGLTAALITAGLLFLPHIATNWIEAKTLDGHIISKSFALIACAAAIRLPIALYTGLLTGLQKQVSANMILFSGNLLRGLGSIGVLLAFDNSVVAYFAWLLISSLVELAFAMYMAWSTQGAQFLKARFQQAQLRENWKFAKGVIYITLTAAAIAQLDKLFLSKLLSLEQFGYYALGATVAYGLFNLVYPICIAASPRFTHLLHSGETTRLSATYHLFAQLCTVMAIPVALILIFYGNEILTLYLRNQEQALKVEPFLRLITLGAAMAILSPLPHALQISSGWTGLISICNTVFALLYMSTLLLVTPTQGVEATITAWILLNGMYLICLAWFMHRRLLPGEFWKWLIEDIGGPVLLGFGAAYMTHSALQNVVMHPLLRICLSYAIVLAVITGGCLHVRGAAFGRMRLILRRS